VRILGSNPFYEVAREIAGGHHENWDGSGYPQGLQGEATPLSARVVKVADVFDALTSRRPYKEPWPVEAALEILREQSGKQFDPAIVAAFLRLHEAGSITRILEEYHG
jgi:putative two-component system response regulator